MWQCATTMKKGAPDTSITRNNGNDWGKKKKKKKGNIAGHKVWPTFYRKSCLNSTRPSNYKLYFSHLQKCSFFFGTPPSFTPTKKELIQWLSQNFNLWSCSASCYAFLMASRRRSLRSAKMSRCLAGKMKLLWCKVGETSKRVAISQLGNGFLISHILSMTLTVRTLVPPSRVRRTGGLILTTRSGGGSQMAAQFLGKIFIFGVLFFLFESSALNIFGNIYTHKASFFSIIFFKILKFIKICI